MCSRRPDTEVTWAIASDQPLAGEVENDPLPNRAALAAHARGLVSAATNGATNGPGIDVRLGRSVEALRRTAAGLEVSLRISPHAATETVVVDRVLALTGSVGDHTMYREL